MWGCETGLDESQRFVAILKKTDIRVWDHGVQDVHGEERSGDGWRTKRDLTALTETKKGKRDEMRLRVTEKPIWNIFKQFMLDYFETLIHFQIIN